MKPTNKRLALLLPFLLALPGPVCAAIPTPDAQWDVNTRGRSDDDFYEHINGTAETTSGTPSVNTDSTYDGINFSGDDVTTISSLPTGIATGFGDSDYTLAVRVKLTTANLTNYQQIFGAYDSTAGSNRLHVLTQTNTNNVLGAQATDGTDVYLNSSFDLDDSAEHVLVIRRNATDLSLWVDGTEVTTDTTTPGTATWTGFTIGGPWSGADSYIINLEGVVYWAAVWESALSDSQVQELDDDDNPWAGPSLTPDDATPDYDQSVVFTLSEALAGGNPTALEFANGDSISCDSATSTTCTVSFAKADFLASADLVNTRIATSQTINLTDGTNDSSTTTITFNSPDNGTSEHFNTSNCADPSCDDDSLYENADFKAEYTNFASGDDVWLSVESGACDFSAGGVFECTSLPASGKVRVYDVTATDWLGELSWTIPLPSGDCGFAIALAPTVRPIAYSPAKAPACN